MGSLQLRLFLTYFAVIAVTLGLAALSLFLLLGGYRDSITYATLSDLAPVLEQQIAAEARGLAQAPDTSDGIPPGSRLLLFVRSLIGDGTTASGDTALAVVDAEGSILPSGWASSTPLEGGRIDPPPSTSAMRRCTLRPPDGPALLCVAVPLSEPTSQAFADSGGVALVVAKPAAGLGDVLADLMPRLLFSGLIGVAAALVLGFLLAQSVAAPLRNIARAARNVARGNYQQRVPATGPAEVRDLAANFNRMTEEVQRSQQTLREFLANISHELKTPLTSIRGFSEAVLDGTIDDEQGVRRSARIIRDEAERVLRLVEELLDLSRIESGQARMRQEPIDLRELFAHVAEVFALRSEESGVQLVVDAQHQRLVRGDVDRIEQVLNNLLDNAFRHTPRGGLIRIFSKDVGNDAVQVAVSDTGWGIPAEEIPHLFERFYRARSQFAANGKGHGLGLAICREIVRAHGGDIWATSEEGRGTTFVFTLPSAGRGARRDDARSSPAR